MATAISNFVGVVCPGLESFVLLGPLILFFFACPSGLGGKIHEPPAGEISNLSPVFPSKLENLLLFHY